MTAQHSSSITGIWAQGVAWAVLIWGASGAAFAGTEATPERPVTAVYKARELSFFYRSSAAFYPCYELQNRVTNILRAVGARDDVQVNASGCDNFIMPEPESTFDREDPFEQRDRLGGRGGFDRSMDPTRARERERQREQSVHVRIRAMIPVEMTPAVLAEIDKDKSRRELVSRVTGNPIAGMNDPIVFAAVRHPVELSRSSIRLEPKDCHLLEQMSKSVLREMDVRVVRGSLNCDRNRVSRFVPQVTVEALVPTGQILPMPDPSKPQTQQPATESTQPAPMPQVETAAE